MRKWLLILSLVLTASVATAAPWWTYIESNLGGVASSVNAEDRVQIEQAGATKTATIGVMLEKLATTDVTVQSVTYGSGYWDDLRIPLTLTKQGSNLKPDFDQTNVGLLFPSGDSSEIAYFVAQVPHGYVLGSSLYPHVHWRQAAGTAVTWVLEYKVLIGGEAVPVPWSTLTSATPVFDYTTGSITQITGLGEVTGMAEVSDLILGKLYRNDSTTAGDVLAYEIDFHYQKDSPGSASMYSK